MKGENSCTSSSPVPLLSTCSKIKLRLRQQRSTPLTDKFHLHADNFIYRQPLTHKDSDFSGQLTLALCGAVLFAANVAPTEEVIQIAIETSPWRLLGLALLSMLLATMILFYSDFTGSQRFSEARGIKTVVFGAVVTYALALVVSAAILWFFGRFDGYCSDYLPSSNGRSRSCFDARRFRW